ncbi:hypothetical protein [Synechococcus sp. MIT S9501]
MISAQTAGQFSLRPAVVVNSTCCNSISVTQLLVSHGGYTARLQQSLIKGLF